MPTVDSLIVEIEADVKGLNKEIDNVRKKMKGIEDDAGKTSSKISAAFAKAGPAIAAGFAVAGAAAVKFFKDSIDIAMDVERQMGQISAILKSTGYAAGQTADDIDEMSRRIALSTLASTKEIRDAAQVLLTFKSVAGDAFERTLVAAQDMAAVLGTSATSAALQLGKALEEPVTGLTALRRAGISFTESEKEMIKSLSETGKTAEAQRLTCGMHFARLKPLAGPQ